MARRDPAKVAQKWSDRLSAAGPDMLEGIQGVTTAPGESAAQREDTMRQRLLEALNSGKWREAVRAITLGQWQEAMRIKGVPRATEAARTSKPKMEAFQREFLPFAEQVSAEIRQMPNATQADREARMLANVRRMREFRRTRR